MFYPHLRDLRLAACLALGLGASHVAWSKPSIQSVGVAPDPLKLGRSFTVTVAASPDVTQATAVLDSRKAQPQLLQVLLSKQGSNWVGSATLPVDLIFDDPHKPEAKLKVLVLDAALRSDEEVVRVPVNIPNISAFFSGGILTITGDDQDDTIQVSLDAANNIVVNGGVVPITGGIPTVTNTTLIRVFGMGGDDVIDIANSNGMPPSNLLGGEGDDMLIGGFGADEIDGGPGNDTLLGRFGVDTLMGGTGNDILIGGLGEDKLFGGAGDDQFQWNPGDSNDVIEGQEDEDTLIVNGANIGEAVDLSANGGRLRFFRNVANIVLDCAGVDKVVFHASGGSDQVVVNDLTGTEVSQVLVNLLPITGLGDGLPDTVVVNGTETNDVIKVMGSTNGVHVLGLTAAVSVLGAEPQFDSLMVNGLGAADEIDAAELEAGAIKLTLMGGLGMDMLKGSPGDDVLIGGRDNDTLFGGEGDDVFPWNPGDGLDVIEGEAGFDTLLFNGANIGEMIDISANGQRVRFTRNIASITLDCNEVEQINFNALGGADVIAVNDLSGTGVVKVNLDLRATGMSTGDTQPDSVTVFGTAGDDATVIAGSAGQVSVSGLAAMVNIVGAEPGLDTLIVRLLAGDDVAEASALAADSVSLVLDGGVNDDVLVGSAGADSLFGDEGDDLLIGGPGLDTLDGGNGNNILIQD